MRCWDIPELCSSHLPVISLTVLKIFSFSGSSGGTLLYLSLLREDELKLVLDLDNRLHRNRRKCVYPLIPVTRKCRLPWILVQLMKLSMLRASTVSLVLLPVPWQAGETHKNGTKYRYRYILYIQYKLTWSQPAEMASIHYMSIGLLINPINDWPAEARFLLIIVAKI